jgi:hypothetical protein
MPIRRHQPVLPGHFDLLGLRKVILASGKAAEHPVDWIIRRQTGEADDQIAALLLQRIPVTAERQNSGKSRGTEDHCARDAAASLFTDIPGTPI